MNFLSRFLSLFAARGRIHPYPGWRLGTGEGKASLLMRLRRRLWEKTKSPVLIDWLNGLRVYAYPGNEMSRSLFLTGYYEPNEFAFLDKVLQPGMTFMDVGANMGLYALFASTKVGKQGVVVAIEPSSREFRRLKTNIEVNGINNVRLLQVAVSHRATRADLLVAIEEKSGHNTLGAFAYDSVVAQGKESVRVERLDDLVLRESLQRVDVFKLDVEGAELFALMGAASTVARYHPLVVLELSDRTLAHQGCSSAEVWQFLTERGYRIYSFADSSGLLVPAQLKDYFESENVVAVHACNTDIVALMRPA